MDNKHFLPLDLKNDDLASLPDDALMAQIRIIAHRLDKQMQLSSSRKASYTAKILEPLTARLRVYELRHSPEGPDYTWALQIEQLYQDAIQKGEHFQYPWTEKPTLSIPQEEFEKLILARRSIRHFNDQPVPKETIKKIVEYGSWAPSTCNVQAVRFIVVKSPEVREKIFHGGLSGSRGDCVIAVVVDQRFYDDYNVDGPVHDSAAAIENMLLSAHYYRLGACYVSDRGVNVEKYRQLLCVKEWEKVTALIWLGHYEVAPIVPARRDVDEIIEFI